MTTPSDPQWQSQQAQGQQPGQQPAPPPNYQGGPPPGYQGGPPPGYQGGPPPGYQGGPPSGYQGGPPSGYQGGPPPGYQGGPPPGYNPYGQPQQGMGGQSSGGFMPPGLFGVPLLTEPPASVVMAFKLYLALVGIYVLGAIVGLIFAFTTFSSGLGVGVAATGSIIGLVFSLIIVAVFLYFVYQMRAGREWARITLAVLTGIAVLFALIGVFTSLVGGVILYGGTYVAVTVVINLVELALGIGALVFMFKPDAKTYFAARR